MIGKNVKLYDMVLQFLRTLFLRTRNVHYCTLRAELLMSLHDLDISEICSVDPCHKVWSQFPICNLQHTLSTATSWLLRNRVLPFHKVVQNDLNICFNLIINFKWSAPKKTLIFLLILLQFSWCLDACIREKFVDAKRARELQGFLDGVKKGQEQVLGYEIQIFIQIQHAIKP